MHNVEMGHNAPLTLGTYLKFLYRFSAKSFENQQVFFRVLFSSFHQFADEQYGYEYFLPPSTVSNLMNNEKCTRLPKRMHMFYFFPRQRLETCFADFWRFVYQIALTEGCMRQLIEGITALVVSADNIDPGDKEYILSFESDECDLLQNTARLCYRTFLTLAYNVR